MIFVVTGSVGVGKSTACKFFKKELDAVYIDADKIGHKIIKDDSIKDTLVSSFGNKILKSGSRVCRTRLGKQVFDNKKKVKLLNSITHPAINDKINERIKNNKKENVVIESSVYHGLKLNKKYKLINIKTKDSIVESRLEDKDLLKRKKYQKPVANADYKIYNNGTKKELEEMLKMVIKKIK